MSMSFNSYHRRGSRSVVQATLAYRNNSECEDLQYPSIDAWDVHVLNNPVHHEQETVSEDSRLYTNEVKSEEFAILSTSSEQESSSFEEEEEEIPLSNSQRIDDWCLQNSDPTTRQRTRTNKRIQDIIKAWGVDEEIPSQGSMQNAIKETTSTPRHPDNYTADLLDELTSVQRSRLQRFTNQTVPLLKRKLNPSYPLYKFQTVPSVFAQRDLLWKCSLHNRQFSNLESIYRYLRAMRSDDIEEKRSDDTGRSSRTSPSLGSWSTWSLVPHLRKEEFTGY